ncbi:exported protein of unknown function [uncultured Woeseiaceae bacterium]|uniref:Uncharacterized protein n=1 Tax=uncultured Woeseiaceae bacterium TaxID=1983305 RepID=A0A7D9D2D2_9GAMM|nr:exported protein of unknown function [uncultured Woeseiaceae bacterium]
MSISYTIHFLIAIIVGVAVAGVEAAAQDASSPCDPSIRQNPGHPQGYQQRSDSLCEGVYATGVSSFSLTLASLTGPLRDIDLGKSGNYRLEWKTTMRGDVRIRADSLRPRFYYRMDTARPASEAGITWKNAIPAYHKLRTREIGLLAMQRDETGKTLYLPVRISPEGQTALSTPYHAMIFSGADIEEVYWSLDRGSEQLVWERAVNRSPYMARQPITIQFDEVTEPGTYHVTITAELRNGMTNAVEFDFLHAN